ECGFKAFAHRAYGYSTNFHKRSDIQAIIEEHGHEIVWLPPYSPDLNPIEKMWAWIKQIRKEWRMDCIDTLCFYLLWIGLGFR
ncbi:transposase, partial [Suttonella ornithocola]|uniref:transposase n=1 Tax=Suttonella ornithocola TaxID=279832 RepID=UPI00200EAAD8